MKYQVCFYIGLMLYVYNNVKCIASEEILQSVFEGSVGAENYTYYTLSYPGHLKVELISLTGDVDLYISDETRAPTMDTYKLQSTTCGTEILEIPEEFMRPVGIGIYGHPSFDMSKYVIKLYELPHENNVDYETYVQTFYNYNEAAYAAGYEEREVKASTTSTPSNQHTSEESEGSIFWQILVDILKLLLEAVL